MCSEYTFNWLFLLAPALPVILVSYFEISSLALIYYHDFLLRIVLVWGYQYQFAVSQQQYDRTHRLVQMNI
jgi:hypothetical protein